MKDIRIWSVFGLLAVGTAVQAQTAGATAKSPAPATMAKTADKEVRRGELLVTFGGCHDCHTPKVMTPNGPQPDTSRLLSGHPSHASLPAVPHGVIGPTQWGALATNDFTESAVQIPAIAEADFQPGSSADSAAGDRGALIARAAATGRFGLQFLAVLNLLRGENRS